MHHKNIIIYLLIQELKHQQLLAGLKKLEFDTELHSISLLEVIAHLLGLPTPEGQLYPEISDELGALYDTFIEKAENYPFSYNGAELEPLAQECFQTLVIAVLMELKENIRV